MAVKEVKIEDINVREVDFVYHVYGVVPEFMPHIAFRREKHFGTANRKIIKCPYCRKTFITVDETEKIELCCYLKNSKVKPHRAMPCKTSHNIVGIIYAVA